MKERPILFSAPMVRALLDGRKMQTRRIVKLPANAREIQYWAPPSGRSQAGWADPGVNYWTPDPSGETSSNHIDPCPYGQPGDRLWVRETWGYRVGCNINTQYQQAIIEYNADMKQLTLDIPPGGQDKLPKQRPCGKDEDYRTYYDDYLTRYWQQWRPSIFMPRWASRINLEITGMRVELLQDISEADAKAEGCERLQDDEPGYMEREEPDWKLCPRCGGTRLYTAYGPNGGACFDTDCTRCDTYAKRYRHLWESINGAGSWNANPWVWVVEFRRLP